MLIFVINKEFKKKEDFGEVKRSFLFITNFCYKIYMKKLDIKYKWLQVILANELLLIIVYGSDWLEMIFHL